MQALADEHSIGAENDVLSAIQNLTGQLPDLRIDHGFAAANRYDRRTAIVHRGETLLYAQRLVDCGLIFADAPAARARQIAGMQRLEHEHHGKFGSSAQALAGDVSRQVCGHL